MQYILLIAIFCIGTAHAQNVRESEVEIWKERAAQWGLSLDEWKRYQKIIAGPRGQWSPNIDPILALGVEAKTDQERRKYARLYLEQEKKRADQELRFLRIYSELYDRFYGSQPLLLGAGKSDWQLTDRIALVVDRSCCNELVRQALVNTHAVDLFVYGANDQQLITWLSGFNVPPEDVSSRKVTLNHAEDQTDAIGRKLGVIFRNRSGVLVQMDRMP